MVYKCVQKAFDKIDTKKWQGAICQSEEPWYFPLTSLSSWVNTSVWTNTYSVIVNNCMGGGGILPWGCFCALIQWFSFSACSSGVVFVCSFKLWASCLIRNVLINLKFGRYTASSFRLGTFESCSVVLDNSTFKSSHLSWRHWVLWVFLNCRKNGYCFCNSGLIQAKSLFPSHLMCYLMFPIIISKKNLLFFIVTF